MIPTEGLIGSYAGQMVVVLVWIGLGVVGSAGLTGIVFVRAAPDITTQVDRVTGVKKRGLVQWFGFWLAVLAGPAVILGLVLTALEVNRRLVELVGPYWWVGALLLASVGGVFAVWRRAGRADRRKAFAPPPVEAPAVEPVQPPTGWSLPEGFVGQWDGRS